MISQPTTARLIEVACDELEAKVRPAVTEQVAEIALAMAISVLRSAAVRAADELAWMREEAEAIEAVARLLVGRLPDAGALADALRSYQAAKGSSVSVVDAYADYARAGEVLSRAAEAAFEHGDAECRREVHRLFEQRRHHENAVTGGFNAVGRA
ncbi:MULTISPECIES: hypothetical protein [unclassified Pseudofrankia]|uniref:hypothetical protein n=1 Tax=unclassified Pseudofrankia TaxID=2994372 RepID=UPI0008D9D8A5|nr:MULTISPECIES: hypothetical protein [unclassified Pseudofrankia]MDT3446903.1 hypothetical protein [Pseudofrankia sp. BMG5.37]OHV49053.1 hypothetical protein BCD48_13275 [Pseudofrankia sp. BMG5.36]